MIRYRYALKESVSSYLPNVERVRIMTLVAVDWRIIRFLYYYYIHSYVRTYIRRTVLRT